MCCPHRIEHPVLTTRVVVDPGRLPVQLMNPVSCLVLPTPDWPSCVDHSMLTILCWPLCVDHPVLTTLCWPSCVNHSMLTIVCWSLFWPSCVDHSMLTILCLSLFADHPVLITMLTILCWSLYADHPVLITLYWPSCVDHSMFATQCLLLARTQRPPWLTQSFITRSTYNTRKEIPFSNCSHNTWRMAHDN